jgi:DNA-binding CsgD family transcriptional regulator/PAS domain-containing protein
MNRATRDERERAEEFQELGELVGDMYEAAVDRRRWQDVLTRVARFAGGPAAAVSFADVSAHFVLAYLGQQINGSLDEPSLDHSKPAAAGVLGLAHVGLADTEALERMQMIAPHLQRAIRIGRLIQSRDEMSATFACTFDGLDAAVFLIDSGGRVLHANSAAQAIVTAEEILRVGAGGRLAACSAAEADHAFQKALTAACRGGAQPDAAEAAVPLIGRDGVHFVAHVLPLKSAAQDRGGFDHAAAAALFVRKVVVSVSSASDVIGKAFRLTPAEQRVLTAIVELGGVPTVASALGLSEATVKTHLVHMFRKTGVSRQQDLVKLVARYLTPLAR